MCSTPSIGGPRRRKTTRSAVMEQWLRNASRQADLQRLEEETAAYYDALTPRERADDAEWAAISRRDRPGSS